MARTFRRDPTDQFRNIAKAGESGKVLTKAEATRIRRRDARWLVTDGKGDDDGAPDIERR